MRLLFFWLALFISGFLHLSVLALACWGWPFGTADVPPLLIEAYGDSDRAGFAIETIAVDAGTWQQGDTHTPGGDDAPG